MLKAMIIIFAMIMTACQTVRVQDANCPTELGFKPGEQCWKISVEVSNPQLVDKRRAALELIRVTAKMIEAEQQ